VCSVLVYDPVLESRGEAASGFTWVSLDRLLAESDYISIHAPLTEGTSTTGS
jgi:phosphoglycerate dehydrogenase-like enzyme